MSAKTQILAMVGILALGLFLTACTKNLTPAVDPSKIISTELSPTLSELPGLTATVETGTTESAPHVTPYVKVKVVEVEIRLLETKPVQVELVIWGTLPDQCKYDFYAVENRTDQNIKVSLDGIHPADTGCGQTEQNIEYVLPLGRDMPEAERGFSPGDYTLKVNNYQTVFSIK